MTVNRLRNARRREQPAFGRGEAPRSFRGVLTLRCEKDFAWPHPGWHAPGQL